MYFNLLATRFSLHLGRGEDSDMEMARLNNGSVLKLMGQIVSLWDM
jgi:hypothetical protein